MSKFAWSDIKPKIPERIESIIMYGTNLHSDHMCRCLERDYVVDTRKDTLREV